MVERITKCEPVPCEPTLVTSGGPKRREKASWSSSVTSWSRNTRTECSSKAARGRIGGIFRSDIGKRHTAQFGGESRTQRDHVHRQALPFLLLVALRQNRLAANDAGRPP